MNWFLTAISWYFIVFLIGLAVFPITKKIFGWFYDAGYAFSKTIAILIFSYSVFLLGILKVLPFSQAGIYLIILFFVIGQITLLVYKPRFFDLTRVFFKNKWLIFLFEELLFLASIIGFCYVRGQEPSIHGLEKFMDFGFINSILRSRFFPPLDMWLSADPTHPNGYAINYYYFGHLTGAFLIKLTAIKASYGYNLILATIFAQAINIVFSIVSNIVFFVQKHLNFKKVSYWKVIFFGIIGSFIVNLSGNLHTIYLFTKGYQPDKPIPFWNILSSYDPTKYWYPNATRFIPFTIHEFPSYSYVVADLHGHVFDIPFVLLTFAILFLLFAKSFTSGFKTSLIKFGHKLNFKKIILSSQIFVAIFLGFLTSVHYMTNAFDGPIYILLSLILFLIVYRLSFALVINGLVLITSFIIFSLPFSIHFSPFVSGIGVNCSPDFLVEIGKLGPFLFEKGNCQISPFWMLFVLWGFFWVHFILLYLARLVKNSDLTKLIKVDFFFLTIFLFGTFLIIVPEFFYIKDIYPAHFRANTMFKLGYQAFIMMGIASSYTIYRLSHIPGWWRIIFKAFSNFFLFWIVIYSFFAFPSYYGDLKKPASLDGLSWMKVENFANQEIVEFLNKNITGQPVVLEAQGDSYTDYNMISAYTGLPTIAGWWVHQWLWRGSSDIVGKKIPDVTMIYESDDIVQTQKLLKDYKVQYVVISKMEKEKYKNLNEKKFLQISRRIFVTSDQSGALYQVNQ